MLGLTPREPDSASLVNIFLFCKRGKEYGSVGSQSPTVKPKPISNA